MNQINNSKFIVNHFKHITSCQRGQLQQMLIENRSISYMSRFLKKTRRAVREEIRRHTVKLPREDISKPITCGYNASIAEYKAYTSLHKPRALKILKFDSLLKKILIHISNGWSIKAAVGYINNHLKNLGLSESISFKTVYNYINDKRVPWINRSLLFYRKRKKRPAPVGKRLNGLSIDQRPDIINKRTEFGHWEMDLICSSIGDKTHLLVLQERMTRKVIIRIIPNNLSRTVVSELDNIETKYGSNFDKVFKTITTDNGVEFTDVDGMKRSFLNTDQERFEMYFANPYHSWEKGSIENANGMIRIKLPKGCKLSLLKQWNIDQVQAWINSYPREMFGYESSLTR